ncbi:MAG: GCN5-related N-acetyltransferase [Holophagaceae bacterium]|nr:GCN5-related N-acetyltransferase [Holophagaceae bacterium]
MSVTFGTCPSMQLPDMRISHAEPKDIPAMVALLGDLFSIEQDFVVDPARQRQGLWAMLEDPIRSMVLVAHAPRTEQAVGMVTLQILVSTAEGGQVGLVEDLVIHPEWRGQGLGAALLAELQHQARLRGLTRLQLLADQENTLALGFYEHQGWARTRMICLRLKEDRNAAAL